MMGRQATTVSCNTALATPSAPAQIIGRDLFLQIPNIFQQPAGMAVTKCINCWPHRAFDPSYDQTIIDYEKSEF